MPELLEIVYKTFWSTLSTCWDLQETTLFYPNM